MPKIDQGILYRILIRKKIMNFENLVEGIKVDFPDIAESVFIEHIRHSDHMISFGIVWGLNKYSVYYEYPNETIKIATASSIYNQNDLSWPSENLRVEMNFDIPDVLAEAIAQAIKFMDENKG